MSKDATPDIHLLIPAAGCGTRTGLDLPKQYQRINGKTILRHTLEKFIAIQGITSIRVIIDPAHTDLYANSVCGLNLASPVHGAATRKESVYNGLSALGTLSENTLILIHDAARPFITAPTIHALLNAMLTSNAATLAAAIADTLIQADYEVVDRDKVRAVQTPQAFRYGLLLKAHEQFKNDTRFTDDAGLVAALGEQIKLVDGPRDNFKITTSEDMIMAEKLLTEPRETHTGFGYDVHAFDPAPAKNIRLGGIDIPHARKLLGHSDADVILHALTDALLGTIGDGDIGQLFPPSDMQWKNANSAIFITEAMRRVNEKGGKIIHADITLLAEAPKIGPHRIAMQTRIATLLGITPDRVGLKATTSEGLGFVGRHEGIAANAVVTVTFPCNPMCEILLT